MPGPDEPLVALRGASLAYGERVLWSDLDLDVRPGEVWAVLGPNGAGKTSLLKALLGLTPLHAGEARVLGAVPGSRAARAGGRVGYVPQQRAFDRDTPLRGRDLVRLGLDGHRLGLGRLPAADRERLEAVLAAVGATAYADVPVGRLSGGEQQRLRIAQALLGDPALLLCDEPLLSLDLGQQQAVVALLDERRREAGTAVVVVTHEVNPLLPALDRVLYLVAGRWAAGTPKEVLTTERLSDLYGAPVDVLRVRDRVVVVGGEDHHGHHVHDHPHVEPATAAVRVPR